MITTVRILVGAIGGAVWFASMIGLLASFFGAETTVAPLLLGLVFFLGALAMLYGAGEWGRWGYLLVFLSIPLSLALFALVPSPVLHSFTLLAVAIPAACAGFTYNRVRAHYARKPGGPKSPGEDTAT